MRGGIGGEVDGRRTVGGRLVLAPAVGCGGCLGLWFVGRVGCETDAPGTEGVQLMRDLGIWFVLCREGTFRVRMWTCAF